MKKRGTHYKSWYDAEKKIRYHIDDVVEWVETTNPNTSTNPTEWYRVYLKQEVVPEKSGRIFETRDSCHLPHYQQIIENIELANVYD